VPIRHSTRIVQTFALVVTLGLAGPLPAPALAAQPLAVQSPAGQAPVTQAGQGSTRAANCPPAWLGTTTNVDPKISANGRFVVFTGYGPDSEVGDRDIFLRDLKRGTTTVVSDPARVSYNFLPSISDDGNRISYLRLDPENFANDAELWVFNRRTGKRTQEGIAYTQFAPDLSATGRYVTFSRTEDGNGNHVDIFVRDVVRNVTRLVSATPAGKPANNTSVEPTISANGHSVLFWSEATDLTPAATDVGNNGSLFVRDVRTGTTRVILDRHGSVSGTYRWGQKLSPDGRYVLYHDTTGLWRYDRSTHRTVAASKPATAKYGFSYALSISAQGRSVAFSAGPLKVRNVRTGKETTVDVGPNGKVDPSGGGGYLGEITPNGRFAVFYTGAKKLDPKDTAHSELSVYVRDLHKQKTTLVSSIHPGGSCD
jgi:Tol biopolymer transport system component